MSGLQITITAAGRAALVNAENTGTAPVRIAQIGVSASSTGLVNGVLDGEIKRLATFAGAAVADDTVHVTIRDDGPDAYSLRSFALYLEGGTLFAWYAHASSVILEKSTQAMLLLAADIRFVEVNAASLAFGDTDWINPPATTTVQGVVELADNAEAIAGIDGTRAMTPAAARAAADDRLGAGAPTTFVKSLLNLATAALFRTAIGLGNVATRNEGAGNGLDADLLDGQHGAYYREWGNLLNKPATFAPSAHRHPWADIDNVPDTAARWPTFAEVTNKPASYTPSAHQHAAADITSGIFDAARIPDLPQNKITGLVSALDSKPARLAGYWPGNDANTLKEFGSHPFTGPSTNTPHSDWATILSVGGGGRTFQLGNSWNYGNEYYFRQQSEGAWSAWVRVWHSGNFNPATKATLGQAANFTSIDPSHSNQGFQFVWNSVNPGNGGNEYINNRGGGGGGHYWYGRTTPDQGPALLGYLTTGGVFVGMGGFQNGSSEKIKDIEGPNPYGLAEIEQIQTVIGRYKPEFVRDQRRRLFVIAEQLHGLVAEPVTEDALEFRGERVPTVDYMQLVPVLIRGVQELAIENRMLRREQAEQRAAIKQILDRLTDLEARG